MALKKAASVVNQLGDPKPEEPLAQADEAPIRAGDMVYYIEQRGPVAATVQFVHPPMNGISALRMWVYGANSIYPKDGVVEGTEPGYYRRR